ncbi:MAG: patatin-like phospholipase family protein [Mycobacteriales bacterium]
MAEPEVAFVLGGGGALGACEIGMLKALLEADVRPDLIVGTSIGALNGVFIAADPQPSSAERLEQLWRELGNTEVFGGSLLRRASTLAKTRTHLQAYEPMHDLLAELLPVELIEDLAVPFQCVAASIERAAEHWFDTGPLIPAVLASCAVPGMMAPVEIGDEHFFDGGLVHSIPMGRAVELGAKDIYVLQVGRIEQPLEPPRYPWQVALVVFEIARRHRFAADMATVPDGVTVHLLPTGLEAPIKSTAGMRRRDFGTIGKKVELAYQATKAYLADEQSSLSG